MSKKLLLSIIVILLLTNIASLIFWKKDNANEPVVEDETIDVNKPVATVDGKKISYDDWITSLRNHYGKKELKEMIDHQIVAKLAKEKDITISDKVIDRDVALLTSMQELMSEKELNDLQAKWKEDIRYRYQLEALLTEDNTIPETDIQNYYTKYKRQYQFSESLQLSHILVSDMETANKVYKELEDGARFDLLAQEYSLDDNTKDNGGYLGFNSSNSEFLPANYFDIAEGLDDYSYSEPFATDNGVAILYLHKSLPEITFSYDELKPYIQRELALQSADQNLIADPLWERLDIEWLYDKK